MFCGTCGTELRPDADTCTACGNRLERKVTLFDPASRLVEAALPPDRQRPILPPAPPAEREPQLDDALDADEPRPLHRTWLLALWRRVPPRDRLILGALTAMLVSLALPWVIINGVRVPAYRAGWPTAVTAIALLAVMLLVAFPQRFLYARALHSVPFATGCFALGSGLVILVLALIAATMNSGTAQDPGGLLIPSSGPASAPGLELVYMRFLGPDIGCFLFLVAAAFLVYIGYQKFTAAMRMPTDNDLASLPWQRTSLPASAPPPEDHLDNAPHADSRVPDPPASTAELTPPSVTRSSFTRAAGAPLRPIPRAIRRRF